MAGKSHVREVLEAIGNSPTGMTDEKDAVALLDIHLGHVQECNESQDLPDLIAVRDGARRALNTTFQVRTTSQLARSHADPLVNALAPLERLIENMQKEEVGKSKSKPLTQAPKVGGKPPTEESLSKVEAVTIPEEVPQVKAKPKLKVPYPNPGALRREIPATWDADKIVTEELFREMLDVHSELFDGQLPTSMDGISIAVLNKLGIGTVYVKAQVWDEKEDGPFNPAKNKDHAQMALDMAPAMVTIVPTKDPKRTVYVNADEYAHPKMGGDGTKPNYDAVNAVMLHESHHASSKGFVNEPYFPDHNLSWKFDECVTEYFTKKVWDSKYSDKADEYFKYTNYFKNENAKKGWYGEAGAKIAIAVGEKVLAAAYFTANVDALLKLASRNKDIEKLVREVM
jgi:hypothetical protein